MDKVILGYVSPLLPLTVRYLQYLSCRGYRRYGGFVAFSKLLELQMA